MKSYLPRLILIAGLLTVMLAAAGCGGAGGPSATVEGFMEAAKDKDCSKMVDYLDIESFQAPGVSITREELISMCEESGMDEIVSYKVIEEKIDGDKAEVKVEATGKADGDEETATNTLNLVKRGDEWKLSTL